jgi:hypothetical protein
MAYCSYMYEYMAPVGLRTPSGGRAGGALALLGVVTMPNELEACQRRYDDALAQEQNLAEFLDAPETTDAERGKLVVAHRRVVANLNRMIEQIEAASAAQMTVDEVLRGFTEICEKT